MKKTKIETPPAIRAARSAEQSPRTDEPQFLITRLWQNYLARLVPEEDARAYFSLRPQNALIAALNKKD